MHQKHSRSLQRWHRGWISFLILTVLVMGMPTAAFAQESEPDDDAAPVSSAGTDGRVNDGTREFGVWWVEDYDPAGPGGSDLPATRPDALGLRDKLTSTCKTSFFGICISNWATPTWTSRFVYGNSNAWASDWRRSQNGGSENSYIDTLDLAYFAGHGSTNGIIFGANSPSPRTVTKNDGLDAWGTLDADWLALAACNVLDDPVSNLQGWANTMNGVRLILGFKTVMNDVPHGVEFGRYIRDGYSLTQAWFKAADKLQSQNRVARVLAEDTAYFDDTWANHASATVVDGTKYYRTHTVGSEPARFVDAAAVNNEMPVLVVQPLTLDQSESQINTLAAAFGVTVTVPSTGTQAAAFQELLANGEVYFSDDGQLEMDSAYGLFLHADKDNLWKTESAMALQAAAGTAMQAISTEQAKEIADGFLNQYGFMPGDAQFYEVASDTLATMESIVAADGSESLAITEETSNYQVIYSRIISYTPSINGASVAAEPVEFSVMGPGAKLKVYVANQVPTGVSGAALYNEAVLGGMGGYRAVQSPAMAAEAGALQMVPMLPFAKVEKLFNTLESNVALDYIPLAPTELVSRQIITHTPAYWEGPIGFSQSELLPIYSITVLNVLTGNVEVTSTTSIPVAPDYMAPLAVISTTADLSENLVPGETVVFEALDATKTLTALGLDPSPNDGNPLDFVLGSGDVSYAWYLNSVAEENRLTAKAGTNGRLVEYTVNLSLGVDAKNTSGTQRMILVVTDDGKNSEPRTSQAVLNFNTAAPVFLPGVNGQ